MDQQIWLMVGMALVTFAIRYPTLALLSRISLPAMMIRALRYVPPAVLTAIIVTGVTMPNGVLEISLNNAYLIAGIITGVIAWRSKNLLLTIIFGMLFFWGYLLLLGALGMR
jgi:branched-subunit amino acid transport protein